jgi:uncharacterized protein YegP (UPF0339 family)
MQRSAKFEVERHPEKPERWRWRIVDEAGKALATSPDMESEKACNDVIEVVRSSLAKSTTTYRSPTYRQPRQP